MAAPIAMPALPKSPVAPPTPVVAKKDDSDIDLEALLAAESLATFPGEHGDPLANAASAEPIIESLDDDVVDDFEVVEAVEEPAEFAEPAIESLEDDIIAEAEPVEAEPVEAEHVEAEHAPIHHLEAPLPLLGAEAPEELVEAVEEIDAVEEVDESPTVETIDAEFEALFAEEPPTLADPPARAAAKLTDREIDLASIDSHDTTVAPAVPLDEEVIEDVFMFEDEPPAKK